MRCSHCDHENGPQARFCEECGARLERLCPSCGQALSPTAKFCAQCGASVPVAPPSLVPDDAKPGAQAALPGERRQATVLFSDLSGYTAMNERLDPEEVRAIVGRIKSEAVRIVEGHGGIVNQFVGDEVVALFGIPQAHEDDPVRAVRAARDLHAMVRAVGPGVEARIGAPLRLHSGISTGLIVTGTEDRRDGAYGITGDAVNTGARLASHAASDSVLVSEETQRAIADYFQTEPLAAVALKGKAARVTPYRVIEQTGITSRFEAAAQRGFTAYAGREAELRALQAALEKARAGQGQFVTVMGEPGIGKSRLLFEFRHSVPRDQATVLTGYCQSYGADTPYLPLVDALRRGLRLDEVHHADALHDHAAAAVRAISPALERYLPQVLHLLSIPSETHKMPATLQGDALRRSFEEALAAVMTENARRQPVVLILEDWHWADEASDSALKHLSGLVAQHPLLVVVTYRTEYERKWAHPQHHIALVLQPLDEADTAAMLRAVWRVQSLPEGLAAQIHARTGGNALFNEEVARGLTESRTVRIEQERALLTGSLEDLQLPDTVHAVIRARVDRLASDAREVLRLASVIGREFALPLLERLHPLPRQIPAALEALARQDLIHPLRVVPEAAYLFKHALVQDVVYDTLLLSQRKTLHEQTGAAIEALYADRLEEQYEALAGHFSKTDNTDKAVEYLEKAGDKAAGMYALDHAPIHFERALRMLESALESPGSALKFVNLTLKWARVASYRRSEQVLRMLLTARGMCERTGSEDLLAQVQYWTGITTYWMGQPSDSETALEDCLLLSRRLGDRKQEVAAMNALGRVYYLRMEYAKSVDFLLKVIPDARAQGQLTDLSYSLGLLGFCEGYLGSFREGLAHVVEAAEIAAQAKDLFREASTHAYFSLLYSCKGDWPSLFDHAERQKTWTHRLGNAIMTAVPSCLAGHGMCLAGRAEAGIQELEAGIRLCEESGFQMLLTLFYGLLADAQSVLGNSRGALESGQASVERAHGGETFGISITQRALGVSHAGHASPDWKSAIDQVQGSIHLSQRHGERPILAVTHFRYAEILHKKGDLPAARAQLSEAEKLFAEMDMTWWSEQATALRARIESGRPFVWFAPYVDGPPKLDG